MRTMLIKGWQVAFLLAVSPVFVQAQILLGPPSLSAASIHTTGGITYFVYSATQPISDWIQASAVTQSGTNFAVTLAEMQGEYCPEWCSATCLVVIIIYRSTRHQTRRSRAEGRACS